MLPFKILCTVSLVPLCSVSSARALTYHRLSLTFSSTVSFFTIFHTQTLPHKKMFRVIKLVVDPGISPIPSLLWVIAPFLVVILSYFLASIPTSSFTGTRAAGPALGGGCWQPGLRDAELRV